MKKQKLGFTAEQIFKLYIWGKIIIVETSNVLYKFGLSFLLTKLKLSKLKEKNV